MEAFHNSGMESKFSSVNATTRLVGDKTNWPSIGQFSFEGTTEMVGETSPRDTRYEV